MKNYYLVFSFMILAAMCTPVEAQSWGYAREGHWVQDIAEDADGSVFALGLSWTDPLFFYSDNFVVKLDENGEELWTNNGTEPSFDFFTGMNVFPSGDGGCFVTGYASYATPAMYKLDADGNYEWDTESWSSGLTSGLLYQGAAAQLIDGRIVIGGLDDDLTYNFVCIGTDGSLLAEFDMLADTVGFAFSYYDFKETGITATADGGFAFSCGKPGYRTLMKFDADLNWEWTNDYAHAADAWEYGQFNNGLKQTSDGGYLLAGSVSDGVMFTYQGSVRKMDADGNLEWVTYMNHGADWEEGGHAVEIDGSYIAWTQDSGDNSSYGWTLNADGVEEDSIFIPIINCSWGFGETGMEVWLAELSSDGGYYLAGRQYLEDCNQRFTVLKSNADGSFPDCVFNCVWPGDANNDGWADADDLFEIGINYGAEGFPREDTGIDWEGKLARAWMEEDTLFWYVLNDLKYTDSDGDGVVGDSDTAAVVANLGLDHPLNTTRTSGMGVPVYFDPAITTLSTGLNQIPILLGDVMTPVDDIYGIAFTIEVESENVDASSLKIFFGDSWMAGADEQLAITKRSETELKVTGAMVRTSRVNTGGYGQIATLDVVVIDNLAGKLLVAEAVTLHITDAKAIMLNRDELILDPTSATYDADIAEPTAVATLADGGLQVYPNPSNGSFVSVSGDQIQQAVLLDVVGQTIRTYAANSGQLDVSGLPAGNYTLRVQTANGLYSGQLVIIQ